MNKIYNNLTIKNLIKTEWINQFDEKQQEQIRLGSKDNLDVLIYAKTELNWKQMKQIRLGLQVNIDVSIYAKKEIQWDEMEQIRLKLLEEKRFC